ncbi:MAG: hypothetical protein KJ927_20610 [Candidatus Eisenbacteria bacterium]|nr:hypothetical protein [Candidatus Eisenbacteria bacterium]
MKYGVDDRFWLVVDPGPESEEADILFEASLRSLDLQFKGGLTMDRNPTLFTDRKEAEIEAFGRLMAYVSQNISGVMCYRHLCSPGSATFLPPRDSDWTDAT